MCAGPSHWRACHVVLETWIAPANGEILAILLLGLGPVGLAFLAWDHATKHGNLPLLGAPGLPRPARSTLLLVAAGIVAPTVQLSLALVLIVGGAALAPRRNPGPGVRHDS